MKFSDRISTALISTKKSFERFPVTIVVSTILTLLLIYLNEIDPNFSEESRKNLEKLAMTMGLGIPLSLCIGLLHERFNRGNKYIKYLFGAILLALYYNFLIKDFYIVTMTRYLGSIIFLLIVMFYALKVNNDREYEKYVIKIFSGGFITIIYSAVLYLGIAAIILTINTLFDANIDSKLYLYVFYIVVFIFGVSLFLSKLPEKNDDFTNHEYPKSLKVLLIYIVIPLITVYTMILYAYFLKIIVTWEWPKGLVSHLVLWYSAISVGVIFLIAPVLEENRIARAFKIWFPKLILPIQMMMFISIFQRIYQYGITENRYYVVVLGLWVFGIMLYFSIKKPLKNIWVPITLSIVVLLSIYGPLSSYSLSKMSQNRRLNNILEQNDMLLEGAVISNANVDKSVQREVSNIISYFNSYHSLQDIQVLPEDFNLEDTVDIFGFAYNPQIYDEAYREFFSYFIDQYSKPIDISGFDYFVNISSWNTKLINKDDLEIMYYDNDHILTVEVVGKDIVSVDLKELAEQIHEQSKGVTSEKNFTDLEKMTINISENDINLKIIFTNIYGRFDFNTEKIDLQSAEFILLVDFK